MSMNEPNIRSQDVRYRQRLGSNAPYRDNPNGTVGSFDMTSAMPNGSRSFDDKPKTRYSSTPSISQLCTNFWAGNAAGDEGPGRRFYRDDFNDQSWSCSVGTTDEHGIWLNRNDPPGTIMAVMVWILLGYSALTITILAQAESIPVSLSMLYAVLCSLALASHVKTSLTDPGSVPPSAVPTEAQRRSDRLAMCSQCQTFKPPYSHHCRICNRCISRMDHHCPWMNNCVGVANMKHFFLFLLYTWTCSAFSLSVLGWNYFFCATEVCTFTGYMTPLAWLMLWLSIGAFLFTSSMIMNVVYGLLTGIGTIDRLKKKATNTMDDSEEEPIPLTDVFGVGPVWQWCLPVDPLFEDHDRVLGFSTPQRLLREEILREKQETGLPMSV
uniref:Palmitoyltransferase n=1 Tax=Craspedostauros australis TaxID=1486917 RepID=A0A7R9ZRC3_9STRA|mmetsp:Transcript_692/g.1949  ORF Transcript_692/g.1949 Transcript_692/m.1949 type:complete len:382 (+) Transcript_692:149-1294(+)